MNRALLIASVALCAIACAHGERAADWGVGSALAALALSPPRLASARSLALSLRRATNGEPIDGGTCRTECGGMYIAAPAAARCRCRQSCWGSCAGTGSLPPLHAPAL